MSKNKKLIEGVSFITGLVFLLLGGYLIYSYIENVFSVIKHSDQSLIFWYLPILFIGTALFGTGIYFVAICYKSFTGSKNATNLLKTSLKYLGIVLLVLVGIIIFNQILY